MPSPSQPKPDVNYTEYLQLDKVLEAQAPESEKYGPAAHDETLFIIVHQAYELWFKQILHELRSIYTMFDGDALAEPDLSTAVHRLGRVVAIQKLLVDQIGILETMTPLDFLDFRDLLVPASGFQSIQFKELEIILGVRSVQRMCIERQSFKTRLDVEQQAYLKSLETQPSLRDLIVRWLERMPFLSFGKFKFWKAYGKAVDTMLDHDREVVRTNAAIPEEQREGQLTRIDATRDLFDCLLDPDRFDTLREQGVFKMSRHAVLSALFIHLYRDEPILHLPYRALSGLIAIDEQLTTWRQKHALMVQRMLGGKIGTGGSSGHDYLNQTATRNRVFVDLFNLSTFLIPRSALPELPPDLRQQLGFSFLSPRG